MKQSYNIGDLLIRMSTGDTALITESVDSDRTTYGTIEISARQIYRLLESGRQHWKHDMQVAAEYERVSRREPGDL
jgi:hypothetical protein